MVQCARGHNADKLVEGGDVILKEGPVVTDDTTGIIPLAVSH